MKNELVRLNKEMKEHSGIEWNTVEAYKLKTLQILKSYLKNKNRINMTENTIDMVIDEVLKMKTKVIVEEKVIQALV